MASTTADLLPTFPKIFFLYVEPVLIAYGMAMNYVASLPLYTARPALSLPTVLLGPSVSEHLVTMILYGLVILLATPPNKRLLQLHIIILVIADFTHWAGLAWTFSQVHPQGLKAVLSPSLWSDDVWQLALYPFGTLAIKFATLRGWFGAIQG